MYTLSYQQVHASVLKLVSVCVYTHTHIYTYTHTHIYIYVCVYIYVCMYIHIPPAANTNVFPPAMWSTSGMYNTKVKYIKSLKWNRKSSTASQVPGSSVGIATRYGLDGPGSNPGGGEIFRTRPDCPWAHPASYTMGTG